MTFLLSDDLVAVRKFRKLTVRDIYDTTRIPLEVIEEIESGYMFSPECHRNKTYIRSFVRGYAKALKISEADATHALDLVEREAYDGFVRRVYLPQSDAPAPSPATPPAPAPVRNEPRITAARASSMIDYKDEVSRPDPTRPHNKATPPPPDVKSIDWVGLGKRFNNFGNNLKYLYYLLGTLGAAALIFAAATYWPESTPEVIEKTEAVQIAPSPDTTAKATPDSVLVPKTVVQAQPVALSLPDSIRLLLFASSDKLEGIRVRTESADIISPYWIEKGQAMEFVFKDSLYIKGQYSRLTLLINGHPITNWQEIRRSDGSLMVTRSYLEANKDWLVVRPLDSLSVKPSKIVPRPVFKKLNSGK
jgi:hypothetical protein